MASVFPLLALGGFLVAALSGKKRGSSMPLPGSDPSTYGPPADYLPGGPMTPEVSIDVPPDALAQIDELARVPGSQLRPSAWRDSKGGLWSDLLAARVANLAWARVGKNDEIREFQIREGEVRGGGWDDGLYGARTVKQLAKFLIAGKVPPGYVPLKGATAKEPTVEIGPIEYTPGQPSSAVSGYVLPPRRTLAKNSTFIRRAR